MFSQQMAQALMFLIVKDSDPTWLEKDCRLKNGRQCLSVNLSLKTLARYSDNGGMSLEHSHQHVLQLRVFRINSKSTALLVMCTKKDPGDHGQLDTLQNVVYAAVRRVRQCLVDDGGHFEHLH